MRKRPNIKNGNINDPTPVLNNGTGVVAVPLLLLPQVCSGINRGGAVYRTGTNGSVGGRLAN